MARRCAEPVSLATALHWRGDGAAQSLAVPAAFLSRSLLTPPGQPQGVAVTLQPNQRSIWRHAASRWSGDRNSPCLTSDDRQSGPQLTAAHHSLTHPGPVRSGPRSDAAQAGRGRQLRGQTCAATRPRPPANQSSGLRARAARAHFPVILIPMGKYAVQSPERGGCWGAVGLPDGRPAWRTADGTEN